MKNKFTDSVLLTNEASVEDLFVSRLIRDLGYGDAEITQKGNVPVERIMLGSRRRNYAPDYVLSAAGKPRVVIDAKRPEERPADWVGQCVSYCATLNRKYEDENPVSHFIITNGLQTCSAPSIKNALLSN